MYLCNRLNPKKPTYMKRLTALLVSLLFISTAAFAQLKANDYEWMSAIRTDHPRMFFTAEDVPMMKNNSLLFDAATFNGMQRRIERLIKKGVEFKNELKENNGANQVMGYRVADAAMLWTLTKSPKYLDFAKMLLERVITHYELRINNNLDISGQGLTIISTLCAYDWLYNDLSAEERAELGKRLYEVSYKIAWHGKDVRAKRPRENTGDYRGTFNGTPVLPWYIGLTFYGEGINDEACQQMLRNGYDQHQKLSAHRARMLGKNGGLNSGTVGNGFDNYPYAEYNFIYTFRSAMGIDITPQMSYMLGYVRYLDWMRLPDNREFGIGDSNHSDNKLPRTTLPHIKEMANLLVESNPDKVDWLTGLIARYNDNGARPSTMHFLPLLHRYHFESEEAESVADANNKQSMHFTNVGQIVMRSGVGDKDTYAVFLTERKDRNRQHFDLNHFVIYKNGYRALDSGARPSPGLHTPYYYCRTVAHNCVTITMPGEKLPKGWGKATPDEDNAPTPNDGGQRLNRGAKLLAHKENADYVYIASDATNCYHSNKVEKVVREFVWIKPDIFVIYDRVESDAAEYTKRWLFHTVSEPQMNGKAEFSEVSQGGKSICRTLLPKKAVVEFIGGEGKQFWSDGKNWAIPEYKKEDPMYKRYRGTPRNNHPLVGQWRVEISPKKAAKADNFLHIIQVGDESLKALPQTDCKESKEAVTLNFDYADKHYYISFDKTRKSGCSIKVTKR